jgi:hypothetical protein
MYLSQRDKPHEHIVGKSCEAWNFFADNKAAIASITSRAWAKVNL